MCFLQVMLVYKDMEQPIYNISFVFAGIPLLFESQGKETILLSASRFRFSEE